LNNDPDAPLVVEIISPLDGKLRVNPLFREGLRQASPEKVEEWQSDLERATLFVKCLQQRNHAIVRLMEKLVKLQKDFIIKGDAFLYPVTRAVLAQELEVHESTISRAVANKIVQLPSGKIIPLSKFFDRSLHIRSELQKIIANEIQPLTDTEIADLLRERGYPVARRTVAKYRAIEGIMPAHLRSKSKNQKQYLQLA
jgi:RNA polymerase sigma-54 factor